MLAVAVVAPLVLGISLVSSTIGLLTAETTYSEYPSWFVLVFGWLMALGLLVIGIVLSLLPWSKNFEPRQARLRRRRDPAAGAVLPRPRARRRRHPARAAVPRRRLTPVPRTARS